MQRVGTSGVFHVLCRGRRCIWAKQTRDDVKCAVDACRDAGGGDDFAVVVKTSGWVNDGCGSEMRFRIKALQYFTAACSPAGAMARRSPMHSWCVVTRRPSRKPILPSKNAPVQTDTTTSAIAA